MAKKVAHITEPEAYSDINSSHSWISDELIRETLVIWQPYSDEELTEEDAIEIILNTSRFLDALQEIGK